jgi:hypothetical protein
MTPEFEPLFTVSLNLVLYCGYHVVYGTTLILLKDPQLWVAMPDHNLDKFGQKIGLCQIFSGQKAQNFAKGQIFYPDIFPNHDPMPGISLNKFIL